MLLLMPALMGDTSYNSISVIGVGDIGSPEIWFWSTYEMPLGLIG